MVRVLSGVSFLNRSGFRVITVPTFCDHISQIEPICTVVMSNKVGYLLQRVLYGSRWWSPETLILGQPDSYV